MKRHKLVSTVVRGLSPSRRVSHLYKPCPDLERALEERPWRVRCLPAW